MNRYGWAALLVGVLFGAGCAVVEDDDPAPDEAGEGGMELSVDFQGDTDVAGFEFVISECDGEVVVEVQKELEDLVLPGMIPEFENDPFDEGSRHLFADYFTTLDAGCYDVEVQPVDADGVASKDCAPASAYGVDVMADKTTEILLISQCDGVPRGALDVIAVLNHPPAIKKLEFEKFNRPCDSVKLCATAFDPDGDPIEFEWTQLAGPKLVEEFTEADCDKKGCASQGPKKSYERQCVEMTLGKAGNYEFKVAVFDLYWKAGNLVRFPNSSTSLKFPVYAMGEADEKCPPKEAKKGMNEY